MNTEAPPVRLASEEVIISAPLSYAGSAQRIWRIRRRSPQEGAKRVAFTALVVLLVVLAWAFVTAWYLCWGILLVPYRLLRRGARKRKVEALRHRELMGTIQGSAAASAHALVTSQISASSDQVGHAPTELVSDLDRGSVIEDLRTHMLAGRLTTDEFEQRLAAAHAARTWQELDAAVHDLPRDLDRQPPTTR